MDRDRFDSVGRLPGVDGMRRSYAVDRTIHRATMPGPADYSRVDSARRYAPPRREYSDYAGPASSGRRYAPDEHLAPTAGASTGAGNDQRYVKLLERDIEALREELRAARERADNPELLRELRETQDGLRAETRRVHELEAQLQGMAAAEDKLAAVQADYDQLRDEFREQQLQLNGLERDLHHAEDAARSAEQREDTYSDQIRRLKEDIHGLQVELREKEQASALAERQHLHDRETQALKHSRELTAAQNEAVALRNELRTKEQELAARKQTIESLEARFKKEIDHTKESRAAHDRILAELKESKAALEADVRAAMQGTAAAEAQITRKDEMIQLLEADTKQRAERIAQLEEKNEALRVQFNELRASSAELEAERNGLQNRVADLESQIETSDALRKEADEREGRLQDQLTELADALQATDAQRRAGTVLNRAETVMKELETLRATVADLKSEHGTLSLESGGKDSRIEQLQATLARTEEGRANADEQISNLRDELLQRTRELKDLTLSHEALHREHRAALEKLARVEEVVASKDEHIENLRTQLQSIKEDGHGRADELRDTLTRATSEYRDEVAQLKAELSRLQTDSSSDRHYAAVCRRLGRLLRLDPSLPDTVFSERIYTNINELVDKVAKLEESARNNAVYPPPTALGLTHEDTLRNSLHRSMTGGLASNGLDTANRYETSLMRDDLRRREQDYAELQMRFDSFVRDVGRLVDSADLHDPDLVLSTLKDSLRQRRAAPPSSDPPAHRGRRRGANPSSSLPSRHGRSTGRHDSDGSRYGNQHDEDDYQKLKKKLSTALKTIESQDMWIDVLNRKLDRGETGGVHGGQSQETRRLEDQIASLKQQLLHATSRPGTSLPTYQSGLGAGASDILAFKHTIADLEGRLQKHIEFRERLLKALGMGVISASDEEILLRVEQLVQGLNRPMTAANNTTSYGGYGGVQAPISSVGGSQLRATTPGYADSGFMTSGHLNASHNYLSHSVRVGSSHGRY
ncbi:uncharacterized protein MONBRDRAFT_10463 [Monosiga brevicollis MX1]|uniref:Uncharacterized protein n=1 Tax=Monosiga brevicollis TaxID=81824 RepID=A9V699_MONBE|nr:uncharacterized protein MONBRDRAFT_10463 [Monosiga brevicollis MX1]EDQ86954.1 predicted protein [Monosiga brevicollis MX1]|eukprot:XP_001748193.1 hypothetical protein [Monosiga brevicollis MX1]